MEIRSFGKNPSGKRLERIKKSPHYQKGKFKNIEPTDVNPNDVSFFRILKKMLFRPSSVKPSRELPNQKTDLKNLHPEGTTVVWFGHSSYFISSEGFKILIDPVFSGNASPFDFFGKAFEGADIYKPEDIPELDLLVLTHDHYDHLDWPTVNGLIPKVKQVVTSLGIGEHLEHWGLKGDKINELDWWQSTEVAKDVKMTAAPSRHFSGRQFKRAQTLWSSFILEINGLRLFIGGDSGYSSTFKKIGEEFGPFDLAFLECGQYNKFWPQIHMFPEETVQAGIDLKAKVLFPVHWGKFVLSSHPWTEPVERFTAAARKNGIDYVSPKIGEAYLIGKGLKQEPWWNFENKGYGE